MQADDLFLQVKWKEAFNMEKESKGFATLMRKQVWAPADLAMLLTVRPNYLRGDVADPSQHEFLQYSPLFPLRPGEAERFKQSTPRRASRIQYHTDPSCSRDTPNSSDRND